MGTGSASRRLPRGLRTLGDQTRHAACVRQVITGSRLRDRRRPGTLSGTRRSRDARKDPAGGGLPAAALCGPAEVMEDLAPVSPVYQAGAFSGDPVAMAAGLQDAGDDDRGCAGLHDALQEKGRSLARALVDAASAANIELVASAIGGLTSFFLLLQKASRTSSRPPPPTELCTAAFFGSVKTRRYPAPVPSFEALFLCTAHTAAASSEWPSRHRTSLEV